MEKPFILIGVPVVQTIMDYFQKLEPRGLIYKRNFFYPHWKFPTSQTGVIIYGPEGIEKDWTIGIEQAGHTAKISLYCGIPFVKTDTTGIITTHNTKAVLMLTVYINDATLELVTPLVRTIIEPSLQTIYPREVRGFKKRAFVMGIVMDLLKSIDDTMGEDHVGEYNLFPFKQKDTPVTSILVELEKQGIIPELVKIEQRK